MVLLYCYLDQYTVITVYYLYVRITLQFGQSDCQWFLRISFLSLFNHHICRTYVTECISLRTWLKKISAFFL